MIDFGKLAAQGRAYSALRAWEPAEFEAVLLIERERDVARSVAADYVRNGIMTLADYDAAVEAAFKPKTLGEATAQAEIALKDHEFATKASPDADEEQTPVAKMKRPQLETLAKELEVEFDAETSLKDLRASITEAQEKKASPDADEEQEEGNEA